MKNKLIIYALAVVFIANFSLAKNEQQKRRRPIIDSIAQDSDGNYVDQIALDTINFSSTNGVTSAENYPKTYHTVTNDFRKTPKKIQHDKVHYITPEPYSDSFSKDYVNQALKGHETSRTKSPASSFLEYSTVTRDDGKKIPKLQRQKVYSSENEDYNYYFPESKKITTKTTAKPVIVPDFSEKYYKPQSSGAIITKDLKTNGDENVNTYHYYYPEEKQKSQNFPSSTFAPSTTKFPSVKFSAKKRTPSVQYQHSSTDSYQYQPVLQRPNEFVSSDQDFYPTFDSKNYAAHSTPTPSTASPVKMLRPTMKNNHYLPSSTMSPAAKSMKIRRPSTEAPYEDVKQFSVSPSPSTMAHYSTTRAPDGYKYSTPSPVSSTTLGNFNIKPSTQITPTAAVDLQHDGSERTVVIRPKSYQNLESYEPMKEKTELKNFGNFEFEETVKQPNFNDFSPKATIKKTNYQNFEMYDSQENTEKLNYESFDPQKSVIEKIIYKYVPEETYNYGSKETISVVPQETFSPNNTFFHSTPTTIHDPIQSIQSPEFYKNLNETSQADMEFYKDFHKNYNYEYFTEQDAGRMPGEEIDETQKMDQHQVMTDNRQRASKKNMYYEINPEMSDEYLQSSMMSMPMNLDEREVPPPMHEITGDRDNDAEASKNQYFVLYDIDDDEKEKKHHKKPRRKQKPEPEVVYHHHHHDHEDKPEEYQHYAQEFDSGFDSELTNTDNVRIVDPNVRGGRPIEFTKDDYLRHIKQAVVQYMKDYTPSEKTKNQRLQETEVPYRPTKTPSAATTASSYRHNLPSHQYKPMTQLKLPKNVYTAGKLKDALDELHESPHVDLTVKKSKQKPFDLSAIDVGQSYQHVSHFDHSAALKNVEDFDQSNIVSHQQQQSKPKLHFSQQTYHDINNLGYNQKQKQQQQQFQQIDDSENEQPQNLYKGYMLPNKYKGSQGSNSFSSMNYDGSKLPRITTQRGHDEDDEDENKVDEAVDAPIQIINGIPVANPYNIDLNTLKYMLGGIAQAEVNDQLKDLDDSNAQQSQKIPSNWKSYSPNQFGSYTSNNPVYQVYGQENNQRQKKNSGQSGNHGTNSQKQQFPLVGSLLNYNKGKNQNQNQNNKQKNNNNGQKNSQNYALSDFSGWNQMNKKQRTEPQAAASNSHFVLRPMMRNKQARDENIYQKGSINRARQPQLATEMRPPPPIKHRTPLLVKKVT